MRIVASRLRSLTSPTKTAATGRSHSSPAADVQNPSAGPKQPKLFSGRGSDTTSNFPDGIQSARRSVDRWRLPAHTDASVGNSNAVAPRALHPTNAGGPVARARRLNGLYGPACATFRLRKTRSRAFW